MNNTENESGRIASLAVFRELYDSEKKDIYAVIACFLKEIIITGAKHSFNLHEITCLLNDMFNFHIPDAVVKTALKRLRDFVKIDNGIYNAQLSGVASQGILSKKEEIFKSNNLIIEQVIDFIAREKNTKISESEVEEITHSFCSFLLDKSNNQKYSEYIGAFIINHQDEPDFIKQLKCIKEGVILYTGIMFNENVSSVGSWNTDLTIFLDTEIIFDFAGFNGDLYKSLFSEFFVYVKEINLRAKRPLIRLRYFTSVERNIQDYFKKAEYIVNGTEAVDPGRSAMNYIINGCKSGSDVIEKKIALFDFLVKNGILVDDYAKYFDEENYKYNITDKELINTIATTIGASDITENLSLLNLVNIRRKESCNNNFEHIGYILLSGNYNTLQIAWHKELRPSGKVPLATSLYFLTDKFWFKLNKGFGNNSFPKVFDIITKAQILLSSQLNKSVGGKFEELQKKYKEGLLSKDQAAHAIIELRKQAKKPEEISEDNISFVLESISENSIQKIFQEQEHIKFIAEKRENENVALINKVSEMDSLLKTEKENKLQILANNNNEKIKNKEDLLKEKKINYSNLENQKIAIDSKIKFWSKFYFKFLPFILTLSYYVALLLAVNYFGWGKTEAWTYFLGLILPLVTFTASIVQERTFNLIKWITSKKEKYIKEKNEKSTFDNEKYLILSKEIIDIENEIIELKKNQ